MAVVTKTLTINTNVGTKTIPVTADLDEGTVVPPTAPGFFLSIDDVPLDETQIPVESGVPNAAVPKTYGIGTVNVIKFTIFNNGDADLNMASIVLIAPNGFPIEIDYTPFPIVTIPAGGSSDFNLNFSPDEVGVFFVQVDIGSDYVLNPFSVTLQLTVNAPD